MENSNNHNSESLSIASDSSDNLNIDSNSNPQENDIWPNYDQFDNEGSFALGRVVNSLSSVRQQQNNDSLDLSAGAREPQQEQEQEQEQEHGDDEADWGDSDESDGYANDDEDTTEEEDLGDEILRPNSIGGQRRGNSNNYGPLGVRRHINNFVQPGRSLCFSSNIRHTHIKGYSDYEEDYNGAYLKVSVRVDPQS